MTTHTQLKLVNFVMQKKIVQSIQICEDINKNSVNITLLEWGTTHI